MVLLDMSKAFDSISHEILLLKLKDVGASNTCLQWFRSYLSDRQQVVRINSTLSESLPLSTGVPQGSILGPRGWDSHMKQTGMLVGNFEFNP